MGENNKKSFWTSLPGILTGIAAVIAAAGGIFAAYNQASPPSSPSSEPATAPPPSSQQKISCGEQLPGVSLFGTWRWSGTASGTPLTGTFTFEEDCSYNAVPISGYTARDEGRFLVRDSPPSITLTNDLTREEKTYLLTDISENSFHASSPDLTVNLDFFRAK
jgi:hypothetical protein